MWRHCGVVFAPLLRCAHPGNVTAVWYLQHFAAAKIVGGTPRFVATLRCGIYSTSAVCQSWQRRASVVFTALRCCQDRGGAAPRFVATLRCCIYSTSAVCQSWQCRACVVFASLRCCQDRGGVTPHVLWRHCQCGICSILLLPRNRDCLIQCFPIRVLRNRGY